MIRQEYRGRVDRILFWVIALGSAGFVAILAFAAYWDHTIIVLHALQSLQYIFIVALAARRNRWGYFLGIAVGGLWDCVTLFVNNFARSGFHALVASLQAGVLIKPDQIIAAFGFVFHLVLILACFLAYRRLQRRDAADWIRLLVSVAVAVAYFAIIVALSQPRYLTIFPRLLHPHIFT
jgi:hypothetical protein